VIYKFGASRVRIAAVGEKLVESLKGKNWQKV
jgi:hypothetical protein